MVIIMKTGQTDDFVVKLKHSNKILGFYLQKTRIETASESITVMIVSIHVKSVET